MKPWLKKSLKILTLLVLLIAGAWIFENWRGHRAWNKAKERADAAGISLDLADFQLPEIPDNENLLKNDYFYNEWVGNVEPRLENWSKMNLPGTKSEIINRGSSPVKGTSLEFTEFFAEDLSEDKAAQKLNEASTDLQARIERFATITLSYPAHPLFNHIPTEENLDPQRTEILSAQRIANCFKDLAILDLRTNRPQNAIDRIRVLDRLANLNNGPALIQHLVSNALRSEKRSIIWEGLRLQSWNQSQLEELLKITTLTRSYADLERPLRYEIAYNLFAFDHGELLADQYGSSNDWGGPKLNLKSLKNHYYKGGPKGWTQQRKSIALNKFLDHLEMKEHWNGQYPSHNVPEKVSPLNPFILGYSSNDFLFTIFANEARFLTQQRTARLAIHLELHLLKHGHYPKSLDDLEGQPQFPDATDPQERPLAFDLDSQGRPQIWSEHEASKHKTQRLRWQYHEKESSAPRRRKSSTRSTPSIKSEF